jgi:hypothetical protein
MFLVVPSMSIPASMRGSLSMAAIELAPPAE